VSWLSRQYLDEGDAGGVVDADMNAFPANSLATRPPVALASAIAGDAVADAVDAACFLDVDVDELARMPSLIAAHRLDGLHRLLLAEPSRAVFYPLLQVLQVLIAQIVAQMPQVSEGARGAANDRPGILT
jgi:hypothetical protein